MNMTENANLILFLQAIGWKDEQITNFILCIEGSRSIKEGAERHKDLNSENMQEESEQ
ncbi:MAG: hypothetical protein J6O55_05080 [Lachnospiraceae bacterium]|nr:hypothetical protein [Lachnospiraceae bacterium]